MVCVIPYSVYLRGTPISWLLRPVGHWVPACGMCNDCIGADEGSLMSQMYTAWDCEG